HSLVTEANSGIAGDAVGDMEGRKSSHMRDAFKQLRKSKLATGGFFIITMFIIIGFIAPMLTPNGLDAQKLAKRLQPPSNEHWFGTDDLGRDILTRIAYGARISLQVGFFAVAGAFIVGTFLGLLSGYFGGWLDMIISRVFDILLAFPSILLAIAIVAIIGASLQNALIAIAIINVPIFGR